MRVHFSEPPKDSKNPQAKAKRQFAAFSASLLVTSTIPPLVFAAEPRSNSDNTNSTGGTNLHSRSSKNSSSKNTSGQNSSLPLIPDLAVQKKYSIHLIVPPGSKTNPGPNKQPGPPIKKTTEAPNALPLTSVTTKNKSSLVKESNFAATPAIPDLPVPGKSAVSNDAGVQSKTAEQKAMPVLDPEKDPKGVLNQALQAYQSGHYGQAAAILATDLQANPDDGTVHYYLGLVLKKDGKDMPALHELEKAARLCPPEMIKRFADEQIGNLEEPEPLKAGPSDAAPPKNDWLSGLGNGINQMFGGKPSPTSTPTVGSATAGNTRSTPGILPDLMGPINDAIKQGKTMLRKAQGKETGAKVGSVDFSRGRSGEAEIMHMSDMQALVQKSHAIGVTDWASSTEGLTSYLEAPENNREWDYWIHRFKRSFQHVLLRRLNAEAKDQVRGAAACIFSLDRHGNLRGQIYASTADPALNKCLVETIRDLNHSRILALPSTSRIQGWNFQMSWNFAIYLAIVKAYRKQKEQQEALETAARIVQEQTKARAKLKAEKDKIALAKRLAAEKILKAKLLKPAPETKIEVSGQVVTPSVERELKAVALELKDLTPVDPNAAQTNVDPFATIDDHTINSWPDLNR